MSGREPKCYENTLKETEDLELESHVKEITDFRDSLLTRVLKHPSCGVDEHPDTSVYSGDGGTIVLLLRLFETTGNKRYLEDASHYARKLNKHIPERIRKPSKEISFIEGYVGAFAVISVVKHYENNKEERQLYIEELVRFAELVLKTGDQATVDSNEVLYGRAGYIHALLYAYHHTQERVLLEIAEKVAFVLVAEGRSFSKEIGSKSPLMYEWHGKRYTAFAHGVSGIVHRILTVYQLLKREGGEIKKEWTGVLQDVKASVDFISETAFPSGNYPTRDDGTDDKLVQWCHGAPAMVFMFCKAFEVFNIAKYATLAERACDVVWERGLLRKGLGLCHGISGNAYCFINTYKITQAKKYLSRAFLFISFAWQDRDTLNALIAQPDEPYSLFIGMGGAVYLCNDLLLLAAKSSHLPADFPTLEM